MNAALKPASFAPNLALDHFEINCDACARIEFTDVPWLPIGWTSVPGATADIALCPDCTGAMLAGMNPL